MEDNVYEVENLNKEEEIRDKEILKKYPKYLPIGSIVILKNAWKKIMITGYLPTFKEKESEIYDYLACVYPEGVIKNDVNICFNHEDIKTIIAIGLIDDEQKDFMKNFKEAIELGEKIN